MFTYNAHGDYAFTSKAIEQFCETIAALFCRNVATDKYRASTKRWLKFSRGPKPPPHKGSVGS